ncbi:sulfotransferase [Novosphingobium sp.]|uniref:sulfotransferase n=1 Tax=Novosphingobium sp. TaxID=1874826 RepID=UPI003B51E3CB
MSDPFETAAAMLATDPALAERTARTLVARAPADPRPRLILASALRRLGRIDEAVPLLLDLAKAWPSAARTRYELGACLLVLHRADDAAVQLDAAVGLDPTLEDAWRAIEALAFARGDTAQESRAQAALARIGQTDPALGQAAEWIVLGQHDRAEAFLKPICQSRPRDTEALRLLSCCYIVASAFDEAEVLLRHALEIRPDFALARFDLARALFLRRNGQAALAELSPLLACDPDSPAYRNLQAACLGLLGDDHGAEAIQSGLADQFPDNPSIAINHGHALRTAGMRDAAIRAYRRALTLRPATGEAWWSLANLKVGALTQADEAVMRGLLARPLPAQDRLHVAYAAGRCAEDAGDIDAAFALYQLGAGLVRQHQQVPLPDWTAELADNRAVFTPAFMAERADWGDPDPAPIFVVGLPRSGSTLLEQILASHPAIEGTMELPFIPALAETITRAGGLAALADTPAATLHEWGAQYLAHTVIHRRLGRARFIDKMPNNFRHIGLIRLILPHARIIDARRYPMASGFSCFKQLFAQGQDFTYDLGSLAAYYRHYLAMMRHFRGLAPVNVRTVIYEDLVDDTEGQVRALLDWLGLAFDPATLRFFENDRAVRTVSSEQVRQPIYRSGLDQWRAFEAHLAPLAAGLGDALDTWRA